MLSKKFFSTVFVFTLLASGLFSSLTAEAKDHLNFYNGRTMDTRITAVIGDLIEYKNGNGKTGTVNRLQLTNRQDIVKTGANQIYTGEILYMDRHNIDIRTPMGIQQVARRWVKEIVLGLPKNEYKTSFMESPHQLLKDKKRLNMGVHPKKPVQIKKEKPCIPCEDQ